MVIRVTGIDELPAKMSDAMIAWQEHDVCSDKIATSHRRLNLHLEWSSA